MAELFVLALIGHLIGDYLLQTKLMALHKADKGFPGTILCTTHVLLYTAAVGLCLGNFHPDLMLAIFIPHWVIDRNSLASHWLKIIKGRTFESVNNSTGLARDFDVAFTAIVYTVTDNTFHLICLWVAIRWLA
jgi:hypothetical protein